MSTQLLNLRHVTDEEADEVRALLERHAIGYYETRPSRWGISAGAIWIADRARVPEARRLMAAYQAERGARVRAEHAAGEADTLWRVLRAAPLRVIGLVAGAAAILALSLLWPLLLRG
ncbi:MAG: hypothetical protein DI564_05300 [Rhodanobacter denitrificans]|uniref:DUF2007 domain-containing protein n=1 Tax=Rhodanobacter denitrificans TaxID=666685 RepID=A0A2W5KS53_9GAMM|nr:MAG: hypothetical protein DI564_05300 [Rhodanobacter denitrificans]